MLSDTQAWQLTPLLVLIHAFVVLRYVFKYLLDFNIPKALCSFDCNNEGTGCPTSRTIAAVLAIFIIYLTNQAAGCPIKLTFVAALLYLVNNQTTGCPTKLTFVAGLLYLVNNQATCCPRDKKKKKKKKTKKKTWTHPQVEMWSC